MKWILLVLGVIVFALYLSGNYFFEKALNTRKLLQKGNKSLTNNSKNTKTELPPYTPGIYCQNATSWLDSFSGKEEAWLTTDHDLKLHAYLLMNEQPTHHYVLTLHGYTSSAHHNGSILHKFNLLGYNVLAPDARAHGQSDGTYTAMGYLERKDVVKWIHWLLQRDPEARIILYGVSMGAATVMFTVGEDLPAAVKGAIEDCGYASVWDEFASELRSSYHLPVFPILNAAELLTKLRMGFTYHQASTVKAVRRAKVPMLFIHGDQDKFVPPYMLDEVYEAHPGEKEKLLIPNAGHGKASSVMPELYWKTIETFLNRNFAK